MLSLHFSDIHFRKTEVGEPDDPNLALRSDIIKDVKRMRAEIGRPIDGIWLTGDIAFAGHADEYEFAYGWLEKELCPAAGCKIEDIFVIPGNHDVDRNMETDPAQLLARGALRDKPAIQLDAEISKWMRGKISSGVIFGPIQNYNRFAAKFLCALRPYIDNDSTGSILGRPFACRDLELDDGSTLRLWGFNTVLLSDEAATENRMLIDPAAAQIEVKEGVCHVVMAHHPFNWLKNRQAFEDRCNAVAHIQLFGHEHTRRVDEGKRYLRIRAGAMHPSRDEPDWKPGYNWIDVSITRVKGKRKLIVRLWVRQYETSHFLAIPDPDGKPIWENAYDLPDWTPPTARKAEERTAEKNAKDEMGEAHVSESPTMQVAPPSIRSVTIKFFKLREHEQRRLITNMNLDRPGDRDMKDYELVIAAVRRSDEQGNLAELDRQIDAALAGGTP